MLRRFVAWAEMGSGGVAAASNEQESHGEADIRCGFLIEIASGPSGERLGAVPLRFHTKDWSPVMSFELS